MDVSRGCQYVSCVARLWWRLKPCTCVAAAHRCVVAVSRSVSVCCSAEVLCSDAPPVQKRAIFVGRVGHGAAYVGIDWPGHSHNRVPTCCHSLWDTIVCGVRVSRRLSKPLGGSGETHPAQPPVWKRFLRISRPPWGRNQAQPAQVWQREPWRRVQWQQRRRWQWRGQWQ